MTSGFTRQAINVSEMLARQFFDYLSMNQYLTIMSILIILGIVALYFAQVRLLQISQAKVFLKEHHVPNPDSEEYAKMLIQISDEEASTVAKLQNLAKHDVAMTIVTSILFVVILASMVGSYTLIDTYQTAKLHGYRSDLHTNASGLWDSINNSPVEDVLPDKLNGIIIIYYRFGCSDCEATYQEIKEELHDIEDVYWIATRSDQGATLIEMFPVDTVPTGIYITEDGTQSTFMLYHPNTSPVQVNTQAIDNLVTTALYDREHG